MLHRRTPIHDSRGICSGCFVRGREPVWGPVKHSDAHHLARKQSLGVYGACIVRLSRRCRSALRAFDLYRKGYPMHAERPFELPDLDLMTEIDHDEGAAKLEANPRQWRAAQVVGVSGLLGLLGNLLFYHFPPGINVPLYLLVFVGTALALVWAFARPIVFHNAALTVLALLFAFLLSVQTAPQLVMLNGLLMIGSLVLALRFASVPRFLGGGWRVSFRAALATAMIGWIEGPLMLLGNAAGYLRQVELEQRQVAHLTSIARGLVLTVPVIGLFALLLSSADVIFQDLLARGLSWIKPENAQSIVAQGVITAGFAWLALTGFRLMLHDDDADALAAPARKTQSPVLFRVGMIEAGMLLGSVDTLFAVFMIIQARYLFGGSSNIHAQGYTFAEYARRGFYELLAVSFMTMLLALTLEQVTHRKRENERVFRTLTGLMIGLTLLVLVAAYYRLHLYQDAYGFTRIRVMSGVFMVWLGLLLIGLLAAILARRTEWFWLGGLTVVCGFVLTLNAMNMDGFIASRNITRYDDTGKLDAPYLLTLSDDAIPAVAGLLARADLPEDTRETLLVGLGSRLYRLDQARAEWHVLGYHIGQARAWRALDEHRAILGPYLRPAWQTYDTWW